MRRSPSVRISGSPPTTITGPDPCAGSQRLGSRRRYQTATTIADDIVIAPAPSYLPSEMDRQPSSASQLLQVQLSRSCQSAACQYLGAQGRDLRARGVTATLSAMTFLSKKQGFERQYWEGPRGGRAEALRARETPKGRSPESTLACAFDEAESCFKADRHFASLLKKAAKRFGRQRNETMALSARVFAGAASRRQASGRVLVTPSHMGSRRVTSGHTMSRVVTRSKLSR